MNIHSKITGELLHVIHRLEEFPETRTNISPPSQFLQVAAINLKTEQTFKPHKHIENIRFVTHAQESWCVLSGRVKAILYDLDDTILEEVELGPGDISITYAMTGHNYIALEPSMVYEYKTPQYEGAERDKILI